MICFASYQSSPLPMHPANSLQCRNAAEPLSSLSSPALRGAQLCGETDRLGGKEGSLSHNPAAGDLQRWLQLVTKHCIRSLHTVRI